MAVSRGERDDFNYLLSRFLDSDEFLLLDYAQTDRLRRYLRNPELNTNRSHLGNLEVLEGNNNYYFRLRNTILEGRKELNIPWPWLKFMLRGNDVLRPDDEVFEAQIRDVMKRKRKKERREARQERREERSRSRGRHRDATSSAQCIMM